MNTYNSRTMKFLRDQGFLVDVVERYNSFIKRRFDAFNILDLLAIKPGIVLGVQSTSQACKSDHLIDLRGEKRPMVEAWLNSGARFWMVTWSKCRAVGSGSKRKVWNPTVTELHLGDNGDGTRSVCEPVVKDDRVKWCPVPAPSGAVGGIDRSPEAKARMGDPAGTYDPNTGQVEWKPVDGISEEKKKGEPNDRTNECDRDKTKEEVEKLLNKATVEVVSRMLDRSVSIQCAHDFEGLLLDPVPAIQDETSRRLNKNRNNKRVHKTK